MEWHFFDFSLSHFSGLNARTLLLRDNVNFNFKLSTELPLSLMRNRLLLPRNGCYALLNTASLVFQP